MSNEAFLKAAHDGQVEDKWYLAKELARAEALNVELLRVVRDFVGISTAIENGVKDQPHTASSVAYVMERARAAIAKASGRPTSSDLPLTDVRDEAAIAKAKGEA
jgi:hypothetical protein